MWTPPRSPDEIVRPSRGLDSPITHHLHKPSFNTNHLNDVETADETNACIWLVMQNGFTKDRTVIFDHLARREETEVLDGLRDYLEGILVFHEEYLDEVRTNISATVEIVYVSIFVILLVPCNELRDLL